jgi:AcrR family transcriptional regulator
MRRRAEQVNQTRQRIVEATAELHGSIGPAATTIAAIANRAGVTRLTVYRQLPRRRRAVRRMLRALDRPAAAPRPGAWSQIGDPAARLLAWLADLYRFFRAGADMLTCIYRDIAALPEEYQQALRDQDTLFGDVLTAPFGSADDEHRLLRAVIGHAISFWTWHSLCLDQDLTDTEAVHAMTGMILAITPVPQAAPAQ